MCSSWLQLLLRVICKRGTFLCHCPTAKHLCRSRTRLVGSDGLGILSAFEGILLPQLHVRNALHTRHRHSSHAVTLAMMRGWHELPQSVRTQPKQPARRFGEAACQRACATGADLVERNLEHLQGTLRILTRFCFKASNTPTGNDHARFSGRSSRGVRLRRLPGIGHCCRFRIE